MATTIPPTDPSAPTSKTTVAESTPAIPTGKTTVTETSPAIPSTKTTVTESSPAIPTAKTTIAESAPAIPTSKTVVAEASPAIPTSKTVISPALMPRTITPLVDMDFAGQCFAQRGIPIAFDDLFTYSRGSSASFVNRRIVNNKYETFLDTDYVGSVTNLLTYSEDFSNAAWVKTNTTFSGGLLYPSSTGTLRSISQVVTATTADHNVSFRVKASGFDWVKIFDAADTNGAWFNVQLGVIGTIDGACEPSIKDAGNGYYDCSIGDAGAISGDARLMLADDNNSTTATTNGLNGVLLSRSQVNLGVKPLTYVKSISTSTTDTFTESLRYEYDPVTALPKGALIEGASTNLLLRSEEFDDVVWVKSGVTVTANSSNAPDDTHSMDTLTSSTVGSAVRQSVTLDTSTDYTISLFVKNIDSTQSRIELYDSGGAAVEAFIEINWTGDAPSTNTLSGSASNANYEYMSDGVYRISVKMTSDAVNAAHNIYFYPDRVDGTKSVYLWGAQCEALPFASSYIRTEGAAVVRSADNLSLPSAGNIPNAGSIYSTHSVFDLGGVFASGAGTNQHIYNMEGETYRSMRAMNNTSGRPLVQNGSNNVSSPTALIANTAFKMTATVSTNTLTLYVDGASVDSDLITNIGGSATNVVVGSSNGTLQSLFGRVKRLSIYDEALTAQEVGLL